MFLNMEGRVRERLQRGSKLFELFFKMLKGIRVWWCTPVIPAFGKQRQVHLCDFMTNLVYVVSSWTSYTNK